MKVVSAIKFEKYVVNISIFSIIIGKFSQWYKSYLVILLKMIKNINVGFHNTILSLNLTVNL